MVDYISSISLSHNYFTRDSHIMITKRLKSKKAIQQYCQLYTAITGLEIPAQYLSHAKVYGYFQQGCLKGGYMINDICNNECRTLNCFVNATDRERISSKISELHSAIELCCFWLSRKTINYRRASMMIWIDMAIKSTIQRCSHIVYGTNVKMLANVYAQPSNSILLHSDYINGKNTWTFYGKKSCMLVSVYGILKARMRK